MQMSQRRGDVGHSEVRITRVEHRHRQEERTVRPVVRSNSRVPIRSIVHTVMTPVATLNPRAMRRHGAGFANAACRKLYSV